MQISHPTQIGGPFNFASSSSFEVVDNKYVVSNGVYHRIPDEFLNTNFDFTDGQFTPKKKQNIPRQLKKVTATVSEEKQETSAKEVNEISQLITQYVTHLNTCTNLKEICDTNHIMYTTKSLSIDNIVAKMSVFILDYLSLITRNDLYAYCMSLGINRGKSASKQLFVTSIAKYCIKHNICDLHMLQKHIAEKKAREEEEEKERKAKEEEKEREREEAEKKAQEKEENNLPVAIVVDTTAIAVASNSSTKKKKMAVPKHIRNIVWNLYIGEDIIKHKCLCCKKVTITNTVFEVGHVLSESSGGTMEINNLRPICGSCNLAMGTTNMIDFVKLYGLYIG
jgi:5-methylcytosine-specific restriction endonuclease McrA